jgi:hypothetical protein
VCTTRGIPLPSGIVKGSPREMFATLDLCDAHGLNRGSGFCVQRVSDGRPASSVGIVRAGDPPHAAKALSGRGVAATVPRCFVWLSCAQ